ncbi:MAG: BON domain-containing protein [Acidobacteriota bacterium]|nr:MAG: BON domain-containing protein [Acidobacteriota bacterium]
MKNRQKLFIVSVLVGFLASACGTVSDAELKTRAQNALMADSATENVTVDVKDGVATISGEVTDDAAKAKAAELAKVEGVSSVTNDVVVAAAPPPLASADDATLKTKVEQALKEQGCDGVQVEVSEGKLTIKGTVSQARYPVCIMAVQVAKPRDRDWDNQLKSEP